MQHKGFGKRFARTRGAAGMTQTQLAEKIGVGRSTVNKWENETDIDPGAKAFRRAAKALNTTEEYLLNGKGGGDIEARLAREMAKYQAHISKLKPKEQEELIQDIRYRSEDIADKLVKRDKSKQEKKDRSAGSKQESKTEDLL